MSSTALLPFQPDAMTPVQLAAVSFLARYSGPTHTLYAYQLRRWFDWCQLPDLDSLVGMHRAHVELYIRHLSKRGLMASSVSTSMHAVRGFFRFAHINGPDHLRPRRLRAAPEGPHRLLPHSGSGPVGTDPVPLGSPNPSPSTTVPRLPARHQRTARFRGRRGAVGGLPRDPAWAPGAAPRRQGNKPAPRRRPSRCCGYLKLVVVSASPGGSSCDLCPETQSIAAISTGWFCGSQVRRHSATHQPTITSPSCDHHHARRGRPAP